MSDFLISFVSILFTVLFYAILGRVLASWIDPQGNFPVTRVLHEITEPILGPIRSIMPRAYPKTSDIGYNLLRYHFTAEEVVNG